MHRVIFEMWARRKRATRKVSQGVFSCGILQQFSKKQLRRKRVVPCDRRGLNVNRELKARDMN